MANRFEGKTALVTGGSRGIGKAIVEALTKEGANVFALGKTKENLDKLKSELPTVNVLQVDLTDWNATQHAVEQLGVVELLVNNAAMNAPLTNFVDIEEHIFENIINVNFKAAFNVSQIVARGLISTGRPGAVVNMSSVCGIKTVKQASAYCVSKSMLEMLTKVMALELGPHKVRVNTVNPTIVKTDMTEKFLSNEEFIGPVFKRHPLEKFAELKDVVDATLFLLSDQAAMITGSNLAVDGGFVMS